MTGSQQGDLVSGFSRLIFASVAFVAGIVGLLATPPLSGICYFGTGRPLASPPGWLSCRFV